MTAIAIIERDELAQRVLTLTINVDADDSRWLVGQIADVPHVGQFRIAATQLDPKLGMTVTLIRESPQETASPPPPST